MSGRHDVAHSVHRALAERWVEFAQPVTDRDVRTDHQHRIGEAPIGTGGHLVENAPRRQHAHHRRLARPGRHLARVALKAATPASRCAGVNSSRGTLSPCSRSCRASRRKMTVSAASSCAKNSRFSRPSRRHQRSSSSVVRVTPGYPADRQLATRWRIAFTSASSYGVLVVVAFGVCSVRAEGTCPRGPRDLRSMLRRIRTSRGGRATSVRISAAPGCTSDVRAPHMASSGSDCSTSYVISQVTSPIVFTTSSSFPR